MCFINSKCGQYERSTDEKLKRLMEKIGELQGQLVLKGNYLKVQL
jgi:hypothetical protein